MKLHNIVQQTIVKGDDAAILMVHIILNREVFSLLTQ